MYCITGGCRNLDLHVLLYLVLFVKLGCKLKERVLIAANGKSYAVRAMAICQWSLMHCQWLNTKRGLLLKKKSLPKLQLVLIKYGKNTILLPMVSLCTRRIAQFVIKSLVQDCLQLSLH